MRRINQKKEHMFHDLMDYTPAPGFPVKKWYKEREITIDQYCYVRNGVTKGYQSIVRMTDHEFKAFGLCQKKGWYKKQKGTKYPMEVAIAAARAGLNSQDFDIAERLRRAFLMGEWDQKQIYVLENQLGIRKIGISIDPAKRCRVLEGASGYKLKVVASWMVKYPPRKIESELHKKYHYAKMEGEWFRAEEVYEEEVEDFIRDVVKCEYIRVL